MPRRPSLATGQAGGTEARKRPPAGRRAFTIGGIGVTLAHARERKPRTRQEASEARETIEEKPEEAPAS